MNMCRFCGQTGGDHTPDCLVRRHEGALRPTPDKDLASLAEVGLEDVIGAKGTKTWSVNFTLPDRSALLRGNRVVETVHVWAATYDGAILLVKECRLDAGDIDALEVG